MRAAMECLNRSNRGGRTDMGSQPPRGLFAGALAARCEWLPKYNIAEIPATPLANPPFRATATFRRTRTARGLVPATPMTREIGAGATQWLARYIIPFT